MLSVVMATYNHQESVLVAAKSILVESCVEKLVIVNDGSTDGTFSKLLRLKKDYGDRVLLLNNDLNYGLAYSLNKGIQKCDTPFIARMDADDLSKSGRLQTQLNYLKQNPNCSILGTYARAQKKGKSYILSKKVEHSALLKDIAWDCPLIHPTVMMRAEVFERFMYDETLRRAQDWELWSRCILEFKIENLPIVGLEYKLTTKKSFMAIFTRFAVARRIEKKFKPSSKSLLYNRLILLKSILTKVLLLK